ncbi:hypothetical protein BGZ94_004956 [Podila epigama]|nr:hypothetical protein BGZ94_004956 [Podila epigama]
MNASELSTTLKPGDPHAAKNTSGIKTQVAISIFLGLVAFLTFCTLRTRWVTMFAPRTKLRRHTPPVLSSTFFGWIPQLLRIPEAEVLNCVGLDAVMMLRFYRMALRVFALCLVPGLLVILPANYYSLRNGLPTFPGSDDDDMDDDDFYRPETDDTVRVTLLLLFTRFTFTWLFSLLTLYMAWHTYEGYITIRRKYMLKRAKSTTNRTVMVIGLPTHLQNDRTLATFYESLGVGSVESAHVCRHVRRLKKLIEQREHALRALEEVYTDYYGNPSGVPSYDPDIIYAENNRSIENSNSLPQGTPNETTQEGADDENAPLLRATVQGKPRPTMRLGFLGLFGKKVDAIDHRREVLATLDKAVIKMRMSRIFAKTSIGFVTFEDMTSAQILAQTVNTQETLTCVTSLAPEPRDVFWDNLNIPPSELGVRSIVVNTTVFFLIFFWAGPVGVFSSFLNLESLEKLIPGITIIAEANPIIKSLIQGFLPTVGVTIFLAVVPKILLALCERQGIQAHSEVARALYNKYFTFILFNVVLVFTIVGTWAQSVNKVYHNVGELALILATSLPRVAPFFVNYIILKGIGLMPVQLLQIGEVIVQTAKGFLSKTPRDYAESRAPPDLKYGVVYSNSTLTFVIVLIYSCIQPLILVFGVIYFGMSILVYKYQLLYVFFHPNESGGLMWPMVYDRIILGLLIYQTTMLGLFLLKQSYMLGAMVMPLLIGTAWFWYWTREHYKNTARYIPLELLRPKEIAALSGHSGSANGTASGDGAQEPVSGDVLGDSAASVAAEATAASPVANGNHGSSSGNGSIAVTITKPTENTVITPRGTSRRMPKSVVDDDDYQAIPDRYTDYRQPPMTLFPGVLNSGMRHYNHPAIAGPLPTLWLPLKKASAIDGKNTADDEESAIGGRHHHRPHLPGHKHSDSDSDDENHSHSLEAALARPPLMLPTQGSDEPQSFEEGDNLVGGGQDEDHSQPAQAVTASVASAPANTSKATKALPEGGAPASAAASTSASAKSKGAATKESTKASTADKASPTTNESKIKTAETAVGDTPTKSSSVPSSGSNAVKPPTTVSGPNDDEVVTTTVIPREGNANVTEASGATATTTVPVPVPVPSPVRGPQAADGYGAASDDSSICTGGPSPISSPLEYSPISEAIMATGNEDAAQSSSMDSKRQSAVNGINDVYYHHPEKRMSTSSAKDVATAPVLRTVQGQDSSASLLKSTGNAESSEVSNASEEGKRGATSEASTKASS